MRILSFSLLIAMAVACLPAQETARPLTNGTIEAMLAGGVPESTILQEIRIAAYRGMADFDGSPEALIALRAKGASENILNAVLWAVPFDGAWRWAAAQQQKQEEEQRVAPGLPEPGGVYVKGPSGWAQLPSVLVWLPFYSAGAWMSGVHEYEIPIDQGSSEVQIGEAMPTFYLREPASRADWQIVRVGSNANRRQIRVTTRGGMERMQSGPAAPAQQARLERMTGDIFALRPASALEPGEYELCTGVPGGPGLKQCYAFGIRR